MNIGTQWHTRPGLVLGAFPRDMMDAHIRKFIKPYFDNRGDMLSFEQL
jgi:hypothetical protein